VKYQSKNMIFFSSNVLSPCHDILFFVWRGDDYKRIRHKLVIYASMLCEMLRVVKETTSEDFRAKR
jgi:hypothetical protein